MIKYWPENDEPVKFRDLVEPIYNAIRFAYSVKRKNKNKDIPYDGYQIGDYEMITSIALPEKFSVENLKWAKDQYGINALREILGVAVQLGIEQGRRVERKEQARLRFLDDL